MQIRYKNRKLEKICKVLSEAEKEYGDNMAAKIHQRVGEIKAASTVESLVQYQIGRCHQLNGKRRGQYAMDLVHPFRLVFEKVEDDIQIAKIYSIEDYH